jgi:GDP-4-dehydro-6-deoxy-D-mannose reductase
VVHSIREVVDHLVSLAPLPIQVKPRPERQRAVDVPVLRGDAGKLRAETGWAPAISFAQTLADTLAYWRSRP